MKQTPFVHIFILTAFLANTFGAVPTAQAQEFKLPAPGVRIHLSPEFTPAHLQGMTIHPDNALQFDFLIQRGDESLTGAQKKEEYTKLVKYFLASLTVPDQDQWVNLSPYEKNRIIEDNFGKTEMGRDLLAQDYILKQITSSLIYPEENLGKKFWDKIYERAWKEYGSTNVPVNTFNKVWIIPDEAVVYESGNTAYVLRNHLKVMLEEDYLSMSKHGNVGAELNKSANTLGYQIVREVILPELEREVNEGKNFANLRQIYSGMILATWYKKALKESLLGKVYANKAKVKGVDQNPKANEEIYQQYLKAFKKGVFNYIKEDVDKYSKQAIPRKYFSGGAKKYNAAMTGFAADPAALSIVKASDLATLVPEKRKGLADPVALAEDLEQVVIDLHPSTDGVRKNDAAMTVNARVIEEFTKVHYGLDLRLQLLQMIYALRESSREIRNLILNKDTGSFYRENKKQFDEILLRIREGQNYNINEIIKEIKGDLKLEPLYREVLEFLNSLPPVSDEEERQVKDISEFVFPHLSRSKNVGVVTKRRLLESLEEGGIIRTTDGRRIYLGKVRTLTIVKRLAGGRTESYFVNAPAEMSVSRLREHLLSKLDSFVGNNILVVGYDDDARAANSDEIIDDLRAEGISRKGLPIGTVSLGMGYVFINDIPPDAEADSMVISAVSKLSDESYFKEGTLVVVKVDGKWVRGKVTHFARDFGVEFRPLDKLDDPDATKSVGEYGIEQGLIFRLSEESEFLDKLNQRNVKLTRLLHATSLENLEKVVFLSEGKLKPGASGSVLFYGWNLNDPEQVPMMERLKKTHNKRFGGIGLEFEAAKVKEMLGEKIYIAGEIMAREPVSLSALTQESKRGVIKALADKRGGIDKFDEQEKEILAAALGYLNWDVLLRDQAQAVSVAKKNADAAMIGVMRNLFTLSKTEPALFQQYGKYLDALIALVNVEFSKQYPSGLPLYYQKEVFTIAITADEIKKAGIEIPYKELLIILRNLDPLVFSDNRLEVFEALKTSEDDWAINLTLRAKDAVGVTGFPEEVLEKLREGDFISDKFLAPGSRVIIFNNGAIISVQFNPHRNITEITFIAFPKAERIFTELREDQTGLGLGMYIMILDAVSDEAENRAPPDDGDDLNEFGGRVGDAAMSGASPYGGIDLNSANLNLQIKRDGKGVPLPLIQQDLDQLMKIQGFVPVIIEIKPAVNLPILSELQQNLQTAPALASAR